MILAAHPNADWTSYGGLGIAQFLVQNPFSNFDLGDAVEDDARLFGYYTRIRYNTLLPWMRRERIVNPILSPFGARN
ncbi:MAG: hypothetical protein Aurels2KO_42630 [Aureliella sp.]